MLSWQSWYWFMLLIFCTKIQELHSLPVIKDPKLDSKALKRLFQWGYLTDESLTISGDLRKNRKLSDALKTFQKFAHIKISGVFDNETMTMMDAPRCGLPDIISTEERERRKRRFVAQGSKWKNKKVTWQLETKNNNGIPNDIVREIMARSFKKWSDYADINFDQLPPTPDGPPAGSSQIRVRFEESDHNDGFPFDGPSGTLAHAFFPLSNTGLSGDIHFDDAEDYTVNDESQSSGKIKLLWVAVHELGHSLGLAHSQLFGAVMYPFYTHFPGFDFSLTEDDINGIQSIYGPRRGKPQPTPVLPISTPSAISTDGKPITVISTTTKKTPTPQCQTRVTAALFYDGVRPYFNNGLDVFVSDSKGFIQNVDEGSFPKLSEAVVSLHRKIKNQRHVSFIHGKTFSVYDSRTHQPVYRNRKLTDGYQGLPDGFESPDATFVLPNNNKLYMFKGAQFWRFTETAALDYTVDYDYPKQIHLHWDGVPDNIDAAFVYQNNDVYFFKGDEYYQYDTKHLQMLKGYPRKNTDGFMRCLSSNAININVVNNTIFKLLSLAIFINIIS